METLGQVASLPSVGEESMDRESLDFEDSVSGTGSDMDALQNEDNAADDQDLSQKLVCSFCNRSFPSRRELLIHQWTHKERQEFVCQVCDKPISNEKLFRRHMSVHFRDYSRHVRCKICQKVFRTPRAMEEHHEKYHRGQKPFVCSTCGLSFSWRDNLFKHERVHVDKPFACLVCHESFRDVGSLNLHIKQHRREQKKEEKALWQKPQELHYRPLLNSNGPQADDENDDKEFQCKICGQSFNYSFTLEAHVKGHADNMLDQAQAGHQTLQLKSSKEKPVEKPHACPTCGEKFRWDFCLRAHVKIHQQTHIDGTVYFEGNKVPKPVCVPGKPPVTRNYKIPSSKKLQMLEDINSSSAQAQAKNASIIAKQLQNQGVQGQIVAVTNVPLMSAVTSPMLLVSQQSMANTVSSGAAVTQSSAPVTTSATVPSGDDLEPGEIRLDHLVDMAVDEDNWEPMVPKPDPHLPSESSEAKKKKARMIRVEQVPLEGRKKTTVVKKIGKDDGTNTDDADDEPEITSFIPSKTKTRLRKEALVPRNYKTKETDKEEGEIDPAEAQSYEEINFTESDTDSGSDFEHELKRKKTGKKSKKKIKTEKQESDEEDIHARRGRGRPKKTCKKKGRASSERQEEEEKLVDVKQGRTTRNSLAAELPVKQATEKRRGRPPKVKVEKDVEVKSEAVRTTRNSTRSQKAQIEAKAQRTEIPEDTRYRKQTKARQDMVPVAKVSKLKVYSCDLCQKAFTKRTALLAHRLFAHKGVKRSAMKQSGFEMIQHKALMNKADHLVRRACIRKSQARPYKCMECEKAFIQQAYLTFHEESHDNITRTYTCHQCDLTMYSWLQCIQHQMLHRKSAR